MIFLLAGVLCFGLAIAALWGFRAKGGVEHPAMRGVAGSAAPIVIVFLLVFGLCGVVAGFVGL